MEEDVLVVVAVGESGTSGANGGKRSLLRSKSYSIGGDLGPGGLFLPAL